MLHWAFVGGFLARQIGMEERERNKKCLLIFCTVAEKEKKR